MDLSSVEVLAEGDLSFLALSWPDESRGLLLCIPCGFIALSALGEGENADAGALIGSSIQVRLPFAASDEQGVEVPLDLEDSVMIVDFGAAVLPRLREVGHDFATEAVFPFISLLPEATPVAEDLLAAAKAWLQQGPVGRMAFYSAQERQPKAKAKKASPKKRVTTADLAVQMGQLTT